MLHYRVVPWFAQSSVPGASLRLGNFWLGVKSSLHIGESAMC